MGRLLVCLLLVVAACGWAAGAEADVTPAAAADKITSLPGLEGELGFDMYSGYVTVNASHGRAQFYWFVEAAAGEPTSQPLLVWLQGGPGCSSLIGLLTENGPIRSTESGGVKANPWSWNRFANVLYIESPAGVGFSYSNTTSDYNTNNNQTAHDNLVFLEAWMERFPQFASSPLWIAGESYGGDYVPDLVNQILDNDAKLASSLAGFIIGNPVLSCPEWEATSNSIEVELFYWHALIPYSAYMGWKTSGCDVPNANPPAKCTQLMNEITDMIGPFDPDDLYADLISGNASLGIGPTPPHSVDNLMDTYFNRPDVQAAIHARPTKWVACCAEPGQSGTQCALNYTGAFPDMMPYYVKFFDVADLDILIYSGDVDIATCPHPYTQLCLSTLKRPVVDKWSRWVLDKQTAGYAEVMDKYTFATVKGAGHEVPMYQPRAAFEMVSHFVAGTFPAGLQP